MPGEFLGPAPTAFRLPTSMVNALLPLGAFTGFNPREMLAAMGSPAGGAYVQNVMATEQANELLGQIPPMQQFLAGVPTGAGRPAAWGTRVPQEARGFVGGVSAVPTAPQISLEDIYLNPQAGYLADALSHARFREQQNVRRQQAVQGMTQAVGGAAQRARVGAQDIARVTSRGLETFRAVARDIEASKQEMVTDIERGIAEVKGFVDQFTQEAEARLSEVRGMAADVVGGARNRAAAMIADQTDVLRGNVMTGIRETWGKMVGSGLPEHERMAVVGAMSIEGAESIARTAMGMAATEGARLDQLAMDAAGMVSNLSSVIVGGGAGVLGAAVGEVGGLLQQRAGQRAQFAQLNLALANEATAFAQQGVLALNQQRMVESELILAGQAELANMINLFEDTTVDLGPFMQGLMGSYLSLKEAEYGADMERFMVEANIRGSTFDQFYGSMDRVSTIMSNRAAQDAAGEAQTSQRVAAGAAVVGSILATVFTAGAAAPTLIGAAGGAYSAFNQPTPGYTTQNLEAGTGGYSSMALTTPYNTPTG